MKIEKIKHYFTILWFCKLKRGRVKTDSRDYTNILFLPCWVLEHIFQGFNLKKNVNVLLSFQAAAFECWQLNRRRISLVNGVKNLWPFSIEEVYFKLNNNEWNTFRILEMNSSLGTLRSKNTVAVVTCNFT